MSGIHVASEYQTKSPAFNWLCCALTISKLQYCHSYLAPFKIRTSTKLVQKFNYQTLKNPVCGCPVFRWLLWIEQFLNPSLTLYDFQSLLPWYNAKEMQPPSLIYGLKNVVGFKLIVNYTWRRRGTWWRGGWGACSECGIPDGSHRVHRSTPANKTRTKWKIQKWNTTMAIPLQVPAFTVVGTASECMLQTGSQHWAPNNCHRC